MKKKEKQGLLILIIVGILIITLIWFVTRPKDSKLNEENNGGTTENISQGEFTKVEQDGTIVNTSEKLKENKEIEGFKISNIKFEEKNGQTELIADVTNTTGKAQKGFLVDIVLLDKQGKEIARIPGNIIETQAGETIEIHAGITERYANAYNFKLEKKQ